MRTFGIFFSAGTKICRMDDLIGLGCKIPQYCLHFLRTMATTRPVGKFSLDLAAFSISRVDSSSRVSPGSKPSSSRTISADADLLRQDEIDKVKHELQRRNNYVPFCFRQKFYSDNVTIKCTIHA